MKNVDTLIQSVYVELVTALEAIKRVKSRKKARMEVGTVGVEGDNLGCIRVRVFLNNLLIQ